MIIWKRATKPTQQLEVVLTSIKKLDHKETVDTNKNAAIHTDGDRPTRWVQASEAIQTTAKWVIGALAGVGAVMFAKGFVTTPELSFQDDRRQLIFAWILGTAGIIGIVVLIWAISRILFPTVITLGTLPSEFRKSVNKDPQDFLPSGSNSLKDFEKGLRGYSKAVFGVANIIRQAKRELSEAETEHDKERAQLALADAVAWQEIVIANRDLYLAKRQELLDRAQFWQASHGYSKRSFWVWLGAGLAAVGGIGYQLALTSPEPVDGGGGGEGSSFPRPAQLRQLDNDASTALWQAARLQECEVIDEGMATIPVFILSGTGTSESPYSVSTIPTEQCSQQTFSVVNDVVLVIEEPKTEIVYTPATLPDPATSS